MLTETSNSWIDLNDELTFLNKSREFMWVSARDGFPHLYLYDYDGHLLRQLTAGAWNVDDFRGRAIKAVDERHRLLYFTATAKSPVERHLYRMSLDTQDPHSVHRISREDGLHSISMSPTRSFYVDTFNSIDQPPQVSLHSRRRQAPHVPDRESLGSRASGRALSRGQLRPGVRDPRRRRRTATHYRLFKPPHFDPKKRYPAIVDVYGGPGVQRVLNSWAGNSFTQILTRAGYVVFQLDNRGTAFRGTAFQAPIHGKLGESK